MTRLAKLESDTIKMLRSVPQICRKPAQLWSTGKDSTLMLYLARKGFDRVPWPVIHIDTGMKPKEIYAFRDWLKIRWQVPLMVISNKEACEMGISPKKVSRYECCSLLKTEALKQAVLKNKFDGLILAIRHDEHYVRGMEDLISLRDDKGNWQYWGRFGGFSLTAPEQEGYNHIRIHPLLPWKEEDVWEYTMLNDLPVNPLYFSRNGKRYRSLGCAPCTEAIESGAASVRQILSEVWETPGLERAGRMQDKENEETMLALRSLGYM